MEFKRVSKEYGTIPECYETVKRWFEEDTGIMGLPELEDMKDTNYRRDIKIDDKYSIDINCSEGTSPYIGISVYYKRNRNSAEILNWFIWFFDGGGRSRRPDFDEDEDVEKINIIE